MIVTSTSEHSINVQLKTVRKIRFWLAQLPLDP